MTASTLPLVITRAQPGAQDTATRLKAMGFAPYLAPMLHLRSLPEPELPPTVSLSGLIFTSANGVRVFQDINSDRALPAWCVGPATALAAREAGFVDVRESTGNADDLATFIGTESRPQPAPLLHIANAAAAGNLKRTLIENGFKVIFAPLYEMQPAEKLPDEFAALASQNTPAIILIHSAKGADALARLLPTPPPDAWTYVAISEKAFAPLTKFTRSDVFYSTVPNENGLMDALNRALATLSA